MPQTQAAGLQLTTGPDACRSPTARSMALPGGWHALLQNRASEKTGTAFCSRKRRNVFFKALRVRRPGGIIGKKPARRQGGKGGQK